MEKVVLEEILSIFPGEQREFWTGMLNQTRQLQEIRIRVGCPIQLLTDSGEFFCPGSEEWTTQEALQKILQHVCHYSLYAYEEELRQGYVTIPGGHRIGMAGQVILRQDGTMGGFKKVQYFNIRIAREKKGVARKLLPYIYREGKPLNVLLVSPPAAGKTTMLRDLVRLISDGTSYGSGLKVGVVDERSELAGCYLGIPQNDVGRRTDVLDGCPKAEGMMLLIRSMSPQLLAVDEIGTRSDAEALHAAFATGCKVFSTIHGEGAEDVKRKLFLKDILKEQWFDRFVFLERKETGFGIREILDGAFAPVEGVL